MLKLDYLYCKENPVKGTPVKNLLLIDNFALKTLEQKDENKVGVSINRRINKKDFRTWTPKLLDIIKKHETVWDGFGSKDKTWEVV